MRVHWYGQSAFLLSDGSRRVLIDPFTTPAAGTPGAERFRFPPIPPVAVDLLLVTHEHGDHTGVGAALGAPAVVRSTAGTFDTPIGQVVAAASEHDDAAGTRRGPNTLFAFTLDGLRICHMGDFGQAGLRAEQAAALGRIDLLFLPVGGGPTIAGIQAAALARQLGARWAVPMHYRTPALGFLESEQAFLDRFSAGQVHRLAGSTFDTADLPDGGVGPLAVVPAPPAPAAQTEA